MNAPGGIITTKQYWRSFDKLSGTDQREVDLAVMKFWRQPDQPGLRLHALNMQEKRFHSISPNMDLRVIVLLDGDKSVLMYVGHHDDAYRWARGRRVERHDVTGSAQVVEYVETIRETVVHVARDAPAAPLFEAFSDDYLLSLGIPRDWLPAVRDLTAEDHLFALVERLPEEAAEALLDLATGGRPAPPVPAAPDANPYATPDAQRRFQVFSDEADLSRALQKPWPEWAVFLHPGQRQLVDTDFTGPARVTGAAGTGKTIVALHRAARLAREGGDVLLTTFSSVLAKRLAAGLDLLLDDDPEARGPVRVQHLHALAAELLRNSGQSVAIMEEKDIRALLTDNRGELDETEFSTPFLMAEWNAIVDYWGVRTRESYLSVSRAGRGNRLTAASREKLWPVFGAVRAAMDGKGAMTWGDLCEAAASDLAARGTPPFDHVVMDEAQDFAPRELALCLQLSRRGTSGLFFAGDAGQRVYKYPFSWSAIGIDVRGRSRRLTVNYRTSAQIKEFADRLLPEEQEQIGGGAELRTAVSRFSGPAPVIIACNDAAEEQARLQDWLDELAQSGVAPSEIAILSRTSRRAKAPLEALEIRFQPLSGDEPDKLFAGTFHGAKGLEFRAIALIGCEEGQVPLPAALKAEVEAEARSLSEDRERHLLYVGCTRARDRLLVLHRGQISRFLSDEH